VRFGCRRLYPSVNGPDWRALAGRPGESKEGANAPALAAIGKSAHDSQMPEHSGLGNYNLVTEKPPFAMVSAAHGIVLRPTQ
jgi:hypothetical protein